VFVTFEGLDGSGKSTQAARLRIRLEGLGREVVAVREPGGTLLGEGIRGLLLDGVGELSPWAEAALFTAARAELVERVIQPALARGADVVCDRYLDSSLAYQGAGRGLGLERVLAINLEAVGGLLPDRTFLLVLPPEAARRRVEGEPDRIEREGDAFRARVEGGYRALVERFPDRIVPIDGEGAPEEVAARIDEQLRDLSGAG